MVSKISLVCLEHVLDQVLIFFNKVHCSEKQELKSLHFYLVSIIIVIYLS